MRVSDGFRYIRRLQKRYNPNPLLDPDEAATKQSGDSSLSVPLAFVSLLRKGTLEKDRSETKLASAFDAVSLGLIVMDTYALGLKACVHTLSIW